ncbi:hypothetical protein B0H19DRAFT_585365 [Mycena capillaripes]|nr:hypothetical protein B0H19DRAFT_585365 [Mycena capillaripes]
MSPRIHEIQARINASIHGRNYNPIEPPGKTSISRISRRERERLEIYGDALLSYKLVSFLFHEFPSHGPHFISTIKSALLSNLTFAKLLMKAHGYLDPRGFDKTVADDFETMAALCYFEYGPKKFEVWFHNTFVPLVNDAACLWPDAASYEEERSTDSRDKRRHSVHHSSTSVSPIEESSLRNAPKRSWVEACIEVATLPVNPTLSSLLPPVELPRTRRRDEEEQPLYKRGWAEAMEVAGNEDRPPQSSWVEAMARTCEPNPLTKKNKKKAQNMHGAWRDMCDRALLILFLRKRKLPAPSPTRTAQRKISLG